MLTLMDWKGKNWEEHCRRKMQRVQRPPGVQTLGRSEGPRDSRGWVGRRAKETRKRFKMMLKGQAGARLFWG